MKVTPTETEKVVEMFWGSDTEEDDFSGFCCANHFLSSSFIAKRTLWFNLLLIYFINLITIIYKQIVYTWNSCRDRQQVWQ